MTARPDFPRPPDEERRLQSLYAYRILDTIPEKEYDSITRIAAQICKTQASLITLLDRDRQWFKSSFGFQIQETPRAISFCNYSILDPQHVLVVPDMRSDDRFSGNPLVTGEPHAVFYAGAPLITPEGAVLGTICVLDGKANDLDEDQKEALQALAMQVVTKLELHKKLYELTQLKDRLKVANNNLKNFARVASHDMKTPLANIMMMTGLYKAYEGKTNDPHPVEVIRIIDGSARELMSFIDQVLVKSENIDPAGDKQETIDSGALLEKVITFIAPPSDIRIELSGNFPEVSMDKTSLQQIFQNLITNAIKYNDKKEGRICISAVSDAKFNHFIFTDNGSGIDKADLAKIFSGKKTPDKKDRYGNTGTGLGLALLKKTIIKAGGKITVRSEPTQGSTFQVSLPLR
jgi:signal transduction histidine kinase